MEMEPVANPSMARNLLVRVLYHVSSYGFIFTFMRHRFLVWKCGHLIYYFYLFSQMRTSASSTPSPEFSLWVSANSLGIIPFAPLTCLCYFSCNWVSSYHYVVLLHSHCAVAFIGMSVLLKVVRLSVRICLLSSFCHSIASDIAPMQIGIRLVK